MVSVSVWMYLWLRGGGIGFGLEQGAVFEVGIFVIEYPRLKGGEER